MKKQPDGPERTAELPATIAIVADPGLPATVAGTLTRLLPALLDKRLSSRKPWSVYSECHRLAADGQGRIDVASAVRDQETKGRPGVTICLTDQPERRGRTPVLATAFTEPMAVLISVPTLGGLRVSRLAASLLVAAVVNLRAPDKKVKCRLIWRTVVAPQTGDVQYLSGPILGRLRLLAGMIRANRPWRLVPSLSGAFAAAVATGGLVLVNSSVWSIAAAMDTAHLVGATLLAIGAMVAWLIIDHSMWETRAEPSSHLAVLYNATTVITLAIGAVFFYAGLLIAGVVAQWILLESRVLILPFGHPIGWADRARLIWLATSMATVGGAVGSGFETDEAVRLAAYGYRQRQRSTGRVDADPAPVSDLASRRER